MSAAPGWYPDPAGQPGYRYWDGRGWTQQVTRNPAQTPGGPGTGGAGQGGGRGPRRGLLIGLIALLIAAVIFAVVRMRTNDVATPDTGDEPSSSVTGWDETSQPSDPPSSATSPEATEESSQVPCPVGDPSQLESHPDDGRVHGGKLSFEPVDTYSMPSGSSVLPWYYDFTRQRQSTEPGWESWFGVGQVKREGGFSTPKQAAIHSLECTIRPDLFSGFESRTDIVSEAVTIGGKKGWKLTSEIRVDSDTISVEGDVVTFIFIDDGRAEWLSGYVSVVPIKDEARLALAATAEKSLAVDP